MSKDDQYFAATGKGAKAISGRLIVPKNAWTRRPLRWVPLLSMADGAFAKLLAIECGTSIGDNVVEIGLLTSPFVVLS